MVDEYESLQAELAELRCKNEELEAEVTRLTADLTEALKRIEELERGQKQTPTFVKPNWPKAEGEKQPRKKRAAEHNTSRKRSEPTRIEKHALERCPDCDYELSGESIDYTREVIELPPPQAVEVIEHQVVKRWCPCCGAWRSPQLDLAGQVFGQGRIGVRIAALVVYLRTKLRLPIRQIQEYLQTLHSLNLSIGEIVELTHTVRRELQPEMDGLLTAVRASAVAHGDETGWRENGQNGYVWGFMSWDPLPVTYFAYHQSRASRVPQGILGLHFQGHLISDFYGGYNVIRGPHQRCWVHMLRDLHDLKETNPEMPDVLAWVRSVRELYDEGKTWLQDYPAPTDAACQEKYADLLSRACAVSEPYALVEHPCRTLAKRILRHQDELFQYVRHPGVPSDNNPAERALRPLVIMRKISGGSRSDEGSKTRLTLFSLVSTWAARGLNPFLHCLTLLQPAAASP
ncbi:MAG: IS66 family transposase [Anaerolineae bacterium]|nr:IS66 family transposase [Anaerolineae bacterium]